MVDSTSGGTAVMSDCIEEPEHIRMDQLDNAAAIYYRHTLTLIKLRQKGASRIRKVPKAVF